NRIGAPSIQAAWLHRGNRRCAIALREEVMRLRTNLQMTTVILLTAGTAGAYAASKDEMIKNAMAAAPKAVGENASVVTFDDKMNMVVLKKGTNGFTCLPNDPTTPSSDPMCVDENGLSWTMALIKKEPAPPEGKIGFGYMLQGETATSNVDPFAPPPADGQWQAAGPHVMIFNPKAAAIAGYPQPGEKPDVTQPWVMWAGSPYEHLMIPVPGE